MEQEILDSILDLQRFGYEVEFDFCANEIWITRSISEELRSSEERWSGFIEAQYSEVPINYKGFPYFILKFKDSDPDTMEGVNELKTMLDEIQPMTAEQYTIIGNHIDLDSKETTGGMLTTGTIHHDPERVKALQQREQEKASKVNYEQIDPSKARKYYPPTLDGIFKPILPVGIQVKPPTQLPGCTCSNHSCSCS